MLSSLWAKNSTPLWIVWKRVNVCLNTSLMSTFPFFFLCLPLPTTPLNTAPHHHPLAATALSAILSRRFLISFDHCQLIRGQHLGGRHGNRQDQIFSALKGGLRFARRGVGNEKYSRDWQLWWPEQSRTEAWMTRRCQCVFARTWVCTCYLISPESAAHPMDAVQWERVEWRVICASVYMCGRRSVETYRELQAAITLDTVYKYFYTHNRFFQRLERGSGLSIAWTSGASAQGCQALLHLHSFTYTPPSAREKLLLVHH